MGRYPEYEKALHVFSVGMADKQIIFAVLLLFLGGAALAGGGGNAAGAGQDIRNSPSPYVRAHADNPVRWLPWSDASFALAREQNKPVFLSIGYLSCYWCHVMERESFRDEQVAQALNAGFVSIKVDREEHPHVDRFYLSAVEAAGKSPGWPMNIFLLPDGNPFLAETYLPRDRFLSLVKSVGNAWPSRQAAIEQQAQSMRQLMQAQQGAIKALAASSGGAAQAQSEARQAILAQIDPQHGGFGSEPKFPRAPYLDLLIHADSDAAAQAARNALDAMALGALQDQVGGGFHRYATDAAWSVPHFEKMLYDQGQLLLLYAQAYARWPSSLYRSTIEQTIRFLDRDLQDEQGLWASSMDARSGGVEGGIYLWSREQLGQVLDAEDMQLLEQVWQLVGPGSDKALRWIDPPAAAAKRLGLRQAALFASLDGIRAKLLKARAARSQPQIDHKIVVSANANVIRGLVAAGQALGEARYVERAAQGAQALLKALRTDKGLHHMMIDGDVHHGAHLDDYAALILALLDLDAAQDASQAWQAQAVAVSDEMIQRLWRAQTGHFDETSVADANLPTTGSLTGDGDTASGQSLAMLALNRLLETGQKRYRPYLRKSLDGLQAQVFARPLSWPSMLAGLPLEAFASQSATSTGAVSGSEAQVSMAVEGLKQGLGGNSQIFDVVLKVQPGWHIQANPASLDVLIPTRVQVFDAQKARDAKIEYPIGKALDTPAGDRIMVYGGDVRIRVSGPGEVERIESTVQACNDEGICLAPANLKALVSP